MWGTSQLNCSCRNIRIIPAEYDIKNRRNLQHEAQSWLFPNLFQHKYYCAGKKGDLSDHNLSMKGEEWKEGKEKSKIYESLGEIYEMWEPHLLGKRIWFALSAANKLLFMKEGAVLFFWEMNHTDEILFYTLALLSCCSYSPQPLYNQDLQLSFCFYTSQQITQVSVYIHCVDNGSQKLPLPKGITVLFIQKVQRLRSCLQLFGSLKPGDAWLDLQFSFLHFLFYWGSCLNTVRIVWVQEHSTRRRSYFQLNIRKKQNKRTLYFHDSLHLSLNQSLFAAKSVFISNAKPASVPCSTSLCCETASVTQSLPICGVL